MSRLLRIADSAAAARRAPQSLLRHPFLAARLFFASESETPPDPSSPIDPFLHASSSGPVYAKLFGNARHTTKSDVVNLLDGCNLTVDDVRVNYNNNFAPVAMIVQFQSRYDFDQAFKAIVRKGRLYRIEKADQSHWDNVKSYDGKTLLLHGIPRMATREDIERLLSGCEFDSSSIQFSFRQAFPYAVRMATVNFPSQILAINAFFKTNRSFCQNNQISVRVLH
ncbi:hypothetical protein MLD38_020259 [Melastoma candidum]|uniref:Uncharacterized protein n=1 Tax=Melastoma candidum TaxID=119954 RepID=A0ACB9QDA7_9MYRT|nr:hypothetical protein MLD38_020259 [Melastoma candidum]